MENKREILLLVFLVVILISVNYRFVDNFLVENFDSSSKEIVLVERVVDGDTVVVNGSSFRLLGINTPEKGEEYYSEAKEFLEDLVLNKTILVEKHGQDRYYRELVYLFEVGSGENINLKVVREGLGNYYFPSGKDRYFDVFLEAWRNCIFKSKNLCARSLDVCSNCIVLKYWDFSEDEIIFENLCDFDCDLSGWDLKDEGRKHFVFEDFVLRGFEEVKISAGDFGESYVWTYSGDSFFLRDSEGNLVLWDVREY